MTWKELRSVSCDYYSKLHEFDRKSNIELKLVLLRTLFSLTCTDILRRKAEIKIFDNKLQRFPEISGMLIQSWFTEHITGTLEDRIADVLILLVTVIQYNEFDSHDIDTYFSKDVSMSETNVTVIMYGGLHNIFKNEIKEDVWFYNISYVVGFLISTYNVSVNEILKYKIKYERFPII